MKKLYLIIFAAIMVAGTAQAHCGVCGDDAKKATDKAGCEMKEAKCSTEKKAECAMKAGKEKAACEMKEAKCSTEKKAECEIKAGKDKEACEIKEAKCSTGKKWYNPVSWFK